MSNIIRSYLLAGMCFASSPLVFAEVREYQLVIDEAIVSPTRKSVKRITVNGQFPAPLLEFEEGDEAIIRVKNNLKNQDSSIHWHGLLLPGMMDGVPGFNGFNGIKPNEEFIYKFKIRQSGTYWYHAHSKGQEQDGLYGSFVIYTKGKKPLAAHEKAERDYVVILSDFHEKTSNQIQKDLKISAEYYQDQRETLVDVWKQIKQYGVKATWSDRKMWNQMRMLKTDISDVTGYTFLMNGKTPEQNWTGMFKPNEKVRLRFVNASAMSFYDVHIPNLKMTVVSADGQPVKPVTVDEFRIGTAETYDVIVEPKADHYQIEAESIDRSGYAIGTLQNELNPMTHGIHVPAPRPRSLLTMEDMGHGGGDHAGMDHSMTHHGDIQDMDHSQHGTAKPQKNDPMVYGWANASTPAGNKALQYSDLKSLESQKDTREANSELVVRLGGTMERYIWTINGKKFSDAEPLKVKYGERIRIKFINDTMMAHPMHLHGMFMQLENGQEPVDMPNKHTLIVPPGKTVTALLTADELGEWAIHCHLLYHMSAGMMNKLIVANVSERHVSTTLIQGTNSTQANQATAQHDGENALSMKHEAKSKMDHTQHQVTSVIHRGNNSQDSDGHHDHRKEHGAQIYAVTTVNNQWLVNHDGIEALKSEFETRIGTDKNKVVIKIHADKEESQDAHYDAKILYSRMISDFWDAQIGARYRSKKLELDDHRKYTKENIDSVIGLHGMAPYFFETDAYLYVSKDNYIGFSLETERDLLISQKLIMQPYLELDMILNDDSRYAKRTGLSNAVLGLETRFEISKKVMPYINIAYEYSKGDDETSWQIASGSQKDWLYGAGIRFNF